MVEQRSADRIPIRLLTSVRVAGRALRRFDAHTRDVSVRGLYLDLKEPVGEGEHLDFAVTLPPVITQTEKIPVKGRGRVVRGLRPRRQAGRRGHHHRAIRVLIMLRL
jgi:hypothetical protein